MTLRALVSLLCMAAAPALAQPPATGSATVTGVEVTAAPPAAIAATFPAQGATVAPGVLVLKVTFDQAMKADTWGYGKLEGAADPRCLGTPRLLPDERTFVLLCTVNARTDYGVGLNLAPDKAFTDRGGRRPAPLELRFKTSAAEPLTTIKAAMTAAGLSALDVPIESMGAYVRPAAD